MKKQMNILYEYDGGLYANITNECPCRCTFCVRSQQDGLGTANSLWLEHAPTAAEVIAALKGYELSRYTELTFCGYGEPFCALPVMLEVCRWARENTKLRLRVNTNGLGDLMWQYRTAPSLEGLLDVVSVSLNAPDAESYNRVTRPQFREDAFEAMLTFAQDCMEFVPDVRFTVVDVLPEKQLEESRALSQRLGVPLRVRHYTE